MNAPSKMILPHYTQWIEFYRFSCYPSNILLSNGFMDPF